MVYEVEKEPVGQVDDTKLMQKQLANEDIINKKKKK